MIHGRKNRPSIMQFTLLNEADMWQLFNTEPYDFPGLFAFTRSLAFDHLTDMGSGANAAYDAAGSGRLGDFVDSHTYPAPSRRPNATGTQYAMVGEFGGVGAFVTGKE